MIFPLLVLTQKTTIKIRKIMMKIYQIKKMIMLIIVIIWKIIRMKLILKENKMISLLN